MENVLLDTNVVLDIALERTEFYEPAKKLIEKLYLASIPAFVTASSVTDIYYVLKKKKGHLPTIGFLKNFFSIIDVVGVDKNIILNSLQSDRNDFEDAVQIETAKQNDISTIITRNKKDFENSGLQIVTPLEYINKTSE